MCISYGKYRPGQSGLLTSRDNTGSGPFSGDDDYVNGGVEDVPGDEWTTENAELDLPGGFEPPLVLNTVEPGTGSRGVAGLPGEKNADEGEGIMTGPKIHTISCVAALAVLAGCYGYAPGSSDDLRPGADVRARISATEAERLRGTIGAEARELRGEMVGADPAEITLRVRTDAVQSGASIRYFHQRVTVPRDQIQQMQVRDLNRWRTIGTVGVVTAAVGYLVAQQFESQDSPSREGDRSSADQIVVPLLRWAPGR